ncbi:hypothetical protein ABFT80_06745 [Mesorhizobium sp. SB112]|uniref:hypothetical protein n=1 Tax=Mesorhizobium sp. SB112 TaxID=3151853 RepID=UPI003264A067
MDEELGKICVVALIQQFDEAMVQIIDRGIIIGHAKFFFKQSGLTVIASDHPGHLESWS